MSVPIRSVVKSYLYPSFLFFIMLPLAIYMAGDKKLDFLEVSLILPYPIILLALGLFLAWYFDKIIYKQPLVAFFMTLLCYGLTTWICISLLALFSDRSIWPDYDSAWVSLESMRWNFLGLGAVLSVFSGFIFLKEFDKHNKQSKADM